MDFSYLCLIPKKEGAKAVRDFRPISLINGVQKIMSKVLANRLNDLIKDVISSSQAAFIKGRSILDSFTTASEIVNWCAKAGIESVGIKTDFDKAFDKVRWAFLRKVLLWLGANQQ